MITFCEPERSSRKILGLTQIENKCVYRTRITSLEPELPQTQLMMFYFTPISYLENKFDIFSVVTELAGVIMIV